MNGNKICCKLVVVMAASAYAGTEELPLPLFASFKQKESKRYRDAVCAHLGLSYLPIGGNGDCFFESVSTLLRFAMNARTDAMHVRRKTTDFLLECLGHQHGILGERCVIEMENELDKQLVSSIYVRRDLLIGQLLPTTVQEYISHSTPSGVWVEGARSQKNRQRATYFPPQVTTGCGLSQNCTVSACVSLFIPILVFMYLGTSRIGAFIFTNEMR
jgi:hypothetical protein